MTITDVIDINLLNRFLTNLKNLFSTKTEVASLHYAGSPTTGGTANKAASIPFGEVDNTSTATAYTATVDGITELRDGICCYLKNNVVTSAAASTAPKCWTLNVNNLGAKPVYVTTAAATYATTHFTVNYKFLFTYDSSLNSNNGGWYISILYNTNTTYSTITQAEIDAGTGTKARNITPKLLRDNFYTEDEVDALLAGKVNAYYLEMEIGVSGNTYSVESLVYNNASVTTFSTIYDICFHGDGLVVIKGFIDNGTEESYHFYYASSNMLGSGYVYFVSPQEEGYFVLHLYSEGSDTLHSSIDYVEYGQGGSGDVNVIEGITMNGSAITPDANKVVNLGTVITEHQDISGKVNSADLATVATSGSYNDLSNKPIIPAAVTESTVSGWGFTKNTGTYSKPANGIPASDLAADVIPDVSGKQDTLVSGTNIKTINKESLLGSGNLSIQAESATIAVGTVTTGAYGTSASVTNSGTSSAAVFDFTIPQGKSGFYPVQSQTAASAEILPNILNLWGEVASLTITLATPTDATIVNEYMIQFTSGSTATTLSLPSTITWVSVPSISANTTYQISIINNLGVISAFTETES